MSLEEFLKDIYRMPDPEWFSNRWGQIVKEWSEKAEKFDRYNLHKISLEENGVWGTINKLDIKLEAIKNVVKKVYNVNTPFDGYFPNKALDELKKILEVDALVQEVKRW